LCLYRTRTGALLVGTTRGLFEMKKSRGRYVLETLWNKSAVYGIQEDLQGRFWLYSAGMLVFLDMQSGLQLEFNDSDGVYHTTSFNSDHTLQTKDGMIILVDLHGFSAFNPMSLEVVKDPVSPMLTKLWVNNQAFSGRQYQGKSEFSIPADVVALDELMIDYQHNNFSLEYSAMEMADPKKNLYRHILEGYDDEWVETDFTNRTATYTNLPPGTYTFRVKASNHHGVWSVNERTLKVIILPPPWRTWWAYSGYGIVIVGLLLWGRGNIVQRERLKSSLAVAKVEQEKEHFELEKAKEVDRVKTSFFTNISHEFRTPLTLIQGPVQDLLEKAGADKKTRDNLKLIHRNSELLLKLINQLLDLAKLESGSLKVENTKGELTGFIRAVASAFTSHSEQKDVRLITEVQPTDLYASFDKDKLETILINLVNNAIKFTPPGGRVITRARLEEENKLHIEVQDSGIGIAPEYHEKIFERFQQLSESHKEVGTGIGLALVKELVLLMKGSIHVKSALNEGSLFTVILPVELVEADSALIQLAPAVEGIESLSTGMQSHESRETVTGLPTVLVVEDNTDLRGFIIDALGEEFNFLEAADGKQGLELASTDVPDLVISDVMMPEMDGITMAGKIRKDIRTSHIPLILLTAKSTDDSRIKGLEGGADDYLTKPFNKSELLLKVRNGISRQYKLREKLRAELMTTTTKTVVQSADDKFLSRVKECIIARIGDEQLSVESLAEEIGMSRVQLYRKLTALTGMSVNELIRKLRLQKAAQLLGQKWGPVSQVAYEVGFSNLSYFSKVFKEEFSVLPSEYETT
jgi:signal transduction histidine kinase/DNA-binding response OmpR family regulator